MSQAVSSEVFEGCVLPSCGNGTVSVGKTTTVEPGEDASVKNSGTCQHVILDFEIPRGETGRKGDTGERGPVGLETVSASIPEDDTPGTPSVVPTFEDGALSLAFSHLKGETGATGPQGEQGIQGIQGIQGPQGIQGERGPIGYQGNTGSSVDYPYELVNNVTTNDAEKGLSAQMGVFLNNEILDVYNARIPAAQLKTISYSLLSDGTWGTSSTNKHFLIPIAALGNCFVAKQGEYTNYIAFFTSDEDPVSGQAAPLVDGTSRITLSPGSAAKFEVPGGTKWLYVSYVSGSYDLKFYRGDLKDNDTLVDQNSYSDIDYSLTLQGKWSTNWSQKHIVIPCQAATKVHLVANTVVTNIAWLTSNDAPSSGGDAPLVSGTSLISVQPGVEWSGVAPIGTYYLYVLSVYSTVNYKPFLLWMDDSDVELAQLSGLAECKTYQLTMEMGSIDASTGHPRINAATTEPATRLRSPNYIKFGPKNTLEAQNLEEDETLYIRYYDENIAYIGYEIVSGPLTVPNNTAYIKALILKEAEFTHTHPLIITSNLSSLEEVKNGEERGRNANIGFVFEVKMPSVPADVAGSVTTFAGNTQRMWDRGYLQLPSQYKAQGDKSPLVLFCHGTVGYNFMDGTHMYDELLPFFTHNGYVVADCSGMTAYYGSELYENYWENVHSKMNPLLTSCYASLVEWLCRDYNIDHDRIYLLSKSAGGLLATWLCYNSPFKIRAVANLAPALCLTGQSFRVAQQDALQFWLERFGITGHMFSAWLEGEGDMEYVLNNLDKVRGWDPFFLGTDMDYDAIIADMYDIPKSSTGSTQARKVTNAYLANAALMAKINAAKKYQPVPMKIWMAQDDSTVPYDWATMYQGMVRRGSGICYIRTMPSGTGGHQSVDSASDAIKVDYFCKDGEIITTPCAYAEALDWFEQW